MMKSIVLVMVTMMAGVAVAQLIQYDSDGNVIRDEDADIDVDTDTSVQVDSTTDPDQDGVNIINDGDAAATDATTDSDVGIITGTDVTIDTPVENDAPETTNDIINSLDVNIDTTTTTAITRTSNTFVMNGFGWMTRDEEGMFARIMLAERALAAAEDDNYVMADGVLQLDNGATYRLTHDSREQPDEEFSVWADGTWMGTFEINDIEDHGSLIIWQGDLELDGQENYDVEFATNSQWITDEDDLGDATLDSELDARIEERNSESAYNGWSRFMRIFRTDNDRTENVNKNAGADTDNVNTETDTQTNTETTTSTGASGGGGLGY